jgi:penicillin amidase
MRSRHGGIMLKLKTESRSEILSKSFKEAIAVLEKQLGKSVPAWTWNKVHVVEYEHALGKVVCLEEYLMWGHLKFQVLMK